MNPEPAPALAGSKGLRYSPLARRGSTKPSAVLKLLRQLVERFSNVCAIWVLVSDLAIDFAICAMVQSSKAYSMVLEGGFVVVVYWDVAEFHVVTEIAVGGVGGAGGHGFEGCFGVIAADAFPVGVGDDGDGMVADHAPGFQALELPYGKDAEGAFLLGGYEGLDEVVGAGWRLYQGD